MLTYNYLRFRENDKIKIPTKYTKSGWDDKGWST